MAAFRALDRFEPRPSLSAWLNTILLRLAGKAASKADARPGASLDALMDATRRPRPTGGRHPATTTDDPHAAAEAAELRAELAAAIAALPFKYRAAVVTRFVLGLDYAEAAASLEMGLNTYKSHLLRGTRVLREALADRVPGRTPPAAEFDRRAGELRSQPRAPSSGRLDQLRPLEQDRVPPARRRRRRPDRYGHGLPGNQSLAGPGRSLTS